MAMTQVSIYECSFCNEPLINYLLQVSSKP